jgi:hypothetical protein
LSTGIDFDVPVSINVPEFSFVSVAEDEVYNAVMSIKSNAAGVDEIPWSFIKSLLPVLLGTLTPISITFVHFYLFLTLMTFRRLLSTASFVFMRMISRFITVLVFRIYKGVMMRST